MNDTEGAEKSSALGDFVLSLPVMGLTIRATKIIPPLPVVNELPSVAKKSPEKSRR